MISGVLFDLGDTVLLSDWEAIHADFERRAGLSIKLTPRLKRLYLRNVLVGATSLVDILLMLKDEQGNETPIDDLVELYEQLYELHTTIDQELISMIRQLKTRVFVACVTNTNDVHAKVNRARGVFDYFHGSYLSCETGMRKPEKALFEHISHEELIPLDRLLFMDDHIENIKAAKKVGVKTIHFENKNDFIADMRILFPHLA